MLELTIFHHRGVKIKLKVYSSNMISMKKIAVTDIENLDRKNPRGDLIKIKYNWIP